MQSVDKGAAGCHSGKKSDVGSNTSRGRGSGGGMAGQGAPSCSELSLTRSSSRPGVATTMWGCRAVRVGEGEEEDQEVREWMSE